MIEHDTSTPKVNMFEITRGERGEFRTPENFKPLNLGDEVISSRYNAILERCKESSDRLFVLSWEGGKVPRGVQLLGKEIAWTQHGIVTATDGNTVGYYDRLVEWGGDSDREHLMLVYANE